MAERERGDVERTIDSQVFFLHDCWLNFYVCTTYIPYYLLSSIPGKGMSFTRRISQLLTSFCHSGDLAAGGVLATAIAYL